MMTVLQTKFPPCGMPDFADLTFVFCVRLFVRSFCAPQIAESMERDGVRFIMPGTIDKLERKDEKVRRSRVGGLCARRARLFPLRGFGLCPCCMSCRFSYAHWLAVVLCTGS